MNNQKNNDANNMNIDQDALFEQLGQHISRRSMLKSMGFGLAGAIIAPSLLGKVSVAPPMPAVSLTNFTPTPIWDYTPPASYTYNDSLLLDKGAIIITARDQQTYEGVLYSLDTQTKEVRWSHRFNQAFFTPLLIGGVLYAATNNGAIYSIDPATGNILWRSDNQAASNLQLIGGNLIFTSTDGHITALDLQGNGVWNYYLGRSVGVDGASRAVASDTTVMVLTHTALVAVDMQTGNFLWSHPTKVSALRDPSVGVGKVYFTGDFNLYAIDVSTGNQAWKWPRDTTNASFYHRLSVTTERFMWEISAVTSMLCIPTPDRCCGRSASAV